jgi:hypothetical protein
VVAENVGEAGGMAGVACVAGALLTQMALGNLSTQVKGPTLYKRSLYHTITNLTRSRCSRTPTLSDNAQGACCGNASGVCRVREGKRGNDAICIRRTRLEHPYGLRPGQHGGGESNASLPGDTKKSILFHHLLEPLQHR